MYDSLAALLLHSVVALSSPPALAPTAVQDNALHELELVPREGAEIACTVTQSSASEIVEERLTRIEDGERNGFESTSFDGELGWSFDLTTVHVDSFGSVEDGRIRSLERHFERIDGTVVHADGSRGTLESPLDGRRVEFARDAEDAPFDKSFDEPGDEKHLEAILLEDAKVDAFGGWFLPEDGKAGVDDSWEVDATAWNDFLTMGGDYWIDTDDADPPTPESAKENRAYEAQLRENLDGKIECALRAVRSTGDERIAEIALSILVRTEATRDATEEDRRENETIEETTVIEVLAAGTCLWNLDAKRCAAIDIEAEIVDTQTRTLTAVAPFADIATEWITITNTDTRISVVYEER